VPLDASRNSLVVPLLGLLAEQPAHAYDLTLRLRGRYEHLSITRSTITSLLKALERSGLVVAGSPERDGNRPPRVTYELTATGLADFRGKVEAGLRDTPPASADFVMAVAFAAILPAGQASTILDERADRLEGDLAELARQRDGVAEARMLETAYWQSIVAAEVAWARDLARRIRSQDIDWPRGS
jgi:DNA-binding PadR family transcriptional regulator